MYYKLYARFIDLLGKGPYIHKPIYFFRILSEIEYDFVIKMSYCIGASGSLKVNIRVSPWAKNVAKRSVTAKRKFRNNWLMQNTSKRAFSQM